MVGSRTKVGILGDPRPGLNCSDFLVQRFFFACRDVNSLQSTGCVDRYTCRTPHFHMYGHFTDHTAQVTCVHVLKAQGIFVRRKAFLHPRVMVGPLLHATLSTSPPSLSSTSPVLSSSSPNPAAWWARSTKVKSRCSVETRGYSRVVRGLGQDLVLRAKQIMEWVSLEEVVDPSVRYQFGSPLWAIFLQYKWRARRGQSRWTGR